MKLALVHMRHSGTGGTERYLNQIAAHMAARGYVVTVVCRTHEAAPDPAVRFAVVRPFAVGSAWRMWAFATKAAAVPAPDARRLLAGEGSPAKARTSSSNSSCTCISPSGTSARIISTFASISISAYSADHLHFP